MKTKQKTTHQPTLHYLQTHPALNLSYFARELGLDPSNFKKMVAGKIGIKEEVLVKLGELLEPYGYGGLKWWDIKEVDMSIEANWRVEYLAKDKEGMIIRGFYSKINGKVLIENDEEFVYPTHIIPLKNLLNLTPYTPKSKEDPIKVEEWGDFEGEWVAVNMNDTVNVGTLCLDDDYGNFYLDLSYNMGKPMTIHLDPKQHKILPLTNLIKG